MTIVRNFFKTCYSLIFLSKSQIPPSFVISNILLFCIARIALGLVFVYRFSPSITVLPTLFLWMALVCSIYSLCMLLFFLVTYLFKLSPKVCLFYFYSLSSVFLLLPSVDILFRSIAGLILTPATLSMYSSNQSSSSNDSSGFLKRVIDGLQMAFDLDFWGVLFLSIILSSTLCLSIIAYLIFYHFNSKRKSQRCYSKYTFITVGLIFCASVLFLCSPFTSLILRDFRISTLTTKPTEITFLFQMI
ncbi:hypothetical protein GEMRC1_003569 [Eukaryota sp. GEM-RC1]